MWFSGFDAVAKRAKWKLVLLMKAACPAVDLSFWNWTTDRPYPECDEWHQYVTNRINKMDPAVVVLSSWWHGDGIPPHGYSTIIFNGRRGLVTGDRLRSHHLAPRRLCRGDIPYLAQTGPMIVWPPMRQTYRLARHLRAKQVLKDHEQTLKAAAQATGATYVATTPWLCTSTCTAVIGRYDVYSDSSPHHRFICRLLARCSIAEALRPVMAQATPHTRRP